VTEFEDKQAKPLINISARNVLPARIRAIHDDGTMSGIELELRGEERLIATVACTSVAELGLRPTIEVLAIVKAPWFALVAGGNAVKLALPNQLIGTITHIVSGTVNAEVWLRTLGGNELVAVLPHGTLAECGLAIGSTATAVVSPAEIVIGLAR